MTSSQNMTTHARVQIKTKPTTLYHINEKEKKVLEPEEGSSALRLETAGRWQWWEEEAREIKSSA